MQVNTLAKGTFIVESVHKDGLALQLHWTIHYKLIAQLSEDIMALLLVSQLAHLVQLVIIVHVHHIPRPTLW